MTVDEFITVYEQAYTDFCTKIPESLDTSKVKIKTRYVAGGTPGSEQDWINYLKNDEGNIRTLLISPIQFQSNTKLAGGKNFRIIPYLAMDLFHDYEVGTDTDNSEKEFIRDVLRLVYSIGKNFQFHSKMVIKHYRVNVGIRKSDIQSLHYGKFTFEIDMTEIRYS